MSPGAPRCPATGAPPRPDGHAAASAPVRRPGHFFVADGAGTWHAVASTYVHTGYRDGAAAPEAAGPALCGHRPPGRWGVVGGRPSGRLCVRCAACLRRAGEPDRGDRGATGPVRP